MAPVSRAGGTLFIVLAVACGGSPPKTAPSCSYAVSAASQSFAASGGTGSVTVTTGATCTWTAQANAGWIAITNGSNGTGPGTVAYAVTPNSGTSVRAGGLTVAGQAVAISQDGAVASCQFALSPAGATHTKDAGTSSFSVSTSPACQWIATSGASWLTIAPGSAQGTGPGTVSYSIARNNDTGSRTASISVAGQAFAVTQSGDSGACQYSVGPTDFSPCMFGTSMTATIVTQDGCTWTATATDGWITIAGGSSRSGPGSLAFSVTDNWLAPRAGQVLVRWPTPTAGQNIRIAQAGCRYAVNPASVSIAAAGGSGTFDVLQQSDPYTCGGALQNACTWSAVSNDSWITVTSSMPRAGDDRVSYSVARNTTGAARSGTIAVRDQVVRINQGGV